MKSTRKVAFALSIALLITLVISFAAARSARMNVRADSKYRVFCADKKIEVEQRTLEQEKSARGSNVCQLAEFDYASDADKYAENHGGKGSACRCD